jgi:hypothetical protein
MTGAPGEVSLDQLHNLHIRVRRLQLTRIRFTISISMQFPMGPALRKYLGVAWSYRGEMASDVTNEAASAFGRALMEWASDHPVTDGAVLVNLLEELVTMDMPAVALALYDAHREVFPAGDFRPVSSSVTLPCSPAVLSLRSRRSLPHKDLVPAETAPYVNMAQLLIRDNRFDEARQWIESGLEIDANHFGLWDMAWLLKQCDLQGHGERYEDVNRSRRGIELVGGFVPVGPVGGTRRTGAQVVEVLEILRAFRRIVGGISGELAAVLGTVRYATTVCAVDLACRGSLRLKPHCTGNCNCIWPSADPPEQMQEPASHLTASCNAKVFPQVSWTEHVIPALWRRSTKVL